MNEYFTLNTDGQEAAKNAILDKMGFQKNHEVLSPSTLPEILEAFVAIAQSKGCSPRQSAKSETNNLYANKLNALARIIDEIISSQCGSQRISRVSFSGQSYPRGTARYINISESNINEITDFFRPLVSLDELFQKYPKKIGHPLLLNN